MVMKIALPGGELIAKMEAEDTEILQEDGYTYKTYHPGSCCL